MANYECATRTNYFKVKDAKSFKSLIEQTLAGDTVDVFEKKDGDHTLYGFGSISSIDGLPDNGEANYDEWLHQLQKIVADDDAIIIMEAGYENLRYVSGYFTVVTSKAIKNGDLEATALEAAKKLLNNKTYTTQCVY